ncbi:MAG TPA: PIG-L family deacetylase [Rhodanobacteraceae bacterium]|nr:PIG-L family deacetylase [Rhodanobacteraceae bacterium]
MIDALLTREPIDVTVAMVVAHPDDETVSAGSVLSRLRNWKLIHLTDGAPQDMHDAHRAGFETRAQYAAARAKELDCALDALQARPRARIGYGCVDQETAENLRELAQRAREDLAGASFAITHPYEHGHPDHDACSFAVHAACALLRRADGRAPQIIEFASYHVRDGAGVAARFWPDEAHPERELVLDTAECERKARAIECFASQHGLAEVFPVGVERYRTAPKYDFREPAPPGTAWYDAHGWRIDSARWRECAAAALDELQLDGAL